MLLHPDVQKKAQAQIDQVVGHDRLPDFGDRESLPYIDCIVQETLRYVSSLRKEFLSSLVNCNSRRRYQVAPLGMIAFSSKPKITNSDHFGFLGVPHRLTTDDYYRGMFLPKGATVIANAG